VTLDRRLARETAPFAAATLLGFAIVPIGGLVDWGGYALASALMIAVGCSVVLIPWRKLPRMLRVVPSLLFLVAVAVLRDVSGVVAGVGVLTLIPVFWVALHGSRGHLLILVAGVCAFFMAPDLPAGHPDQHPISIWRIALVFGAASAIVGVAVQNLVARVRSHADALAVRERDLEAVADLLRSLSLVTDARGRICAGVCDLSEAYFAVLLEAKPEGGLEWTAAAGLGLPPWAFTPESGPSSAMTAYASRAALFVSDIQEPAGGDVPELDGVAELTGADRPAALLFEPIHHGEEIAGVLVAGWREPPPDDERRARGLVRLLASEAAFVIERADLLGQLTEFALTDELTGLPNRRAWEERLDKAIHESDPLCVAILDLDRFKSYNDDHGHQAGDRLLKEAAAAWRAVMRPADTLARYGGEEFAVLLRETDLKTARSVVDRLRGATPGGQSCSAGIARREGDETASALLGRADHALYEAKRAGRDRSLIAGLGTAGQREAPLP
jgi:diguanylate cyclase (GGDEF)-like protein